MGCTGRDQAVEITAQMVSDFALSIEIAEKKCKLIIKKRAETMKKKDDEIYAALKQRNLDLSLQRMESYLKDENYISALLILKNIFDNSHQSYICISNQYLVELFYHYLLLYYFLLCNLLLYYSTLYHF